VERYGSFAPASAGGGFLLDDEDVTPRAKEQGGVGLSSPPASPQRDAHEVDVVERVDVWLSGHSGSNSARHPDPNASLDTSAAPRGIPLRRMEDFLPTPPVTADGPRTTTTKVTKVTKATKTNQQSTSIPHRPSPIKHAPTTVLQPPRRSPRQQPTSKKQRIELRESLEGWWKEVDAENVVDMSGDGSGWKKSGGRARIVPKGWRKSGVEVLDLTGA